MARQERDTRSRRSRATLVLVGALFLLTAAAECATAQVTATGASDGAAQALQDAKTAFGKGDFPGALEKLRTLRSAYPASPLVPDSLELSVRSALAAGDEYRARYFSQSLLDTYPASPAAFTAGLAMGSYFYDKRSWSESLYFYAEAVTVFHAGVSGQRALLDGALLRCAELTLYHANDEAGARSYIAKIQAASLVGADAVLFREMRVRLLWSVIGRHALGLQDANVSSLRIDGDDLWVGTWNGGVSRYTISTGSADPFPGPAYSRSIEVADRRVWVGTTEGLSWYGKSTGNWGSEDAFGGDSPMKVQVLRRAGSSLYAGTLGDGLFRRGDSGWTR